ncbi:MAG: hypothetical protein KY463_12340 [Actinobacteria bacterium]|nr:hypothetical protein [Actinomycetota bacterium]
MTDERTIERRRLVAALLGPAEPELTCEECFDHLDRYVDTALAGGDPDVAVPAMRAHLIGCPACADDHDSLLEYVRHADEGTSPAP